MKNRKRIITTLIGMALTAQLSPVAYTIVNAQEPAASQVQAQQGQEKNGLANSKIILNGNGCQETSKPGQPGVPGDHEVQISFNTSNPSNKKFDVKVISGHGFGSQDTQHPFHPFINANYITITLLDSHGKIKNNFSLYGLNNISELENALNKWTFEYGDSLSMYHAEAGGRTRIEGTVLAPNGTTVKCDTQIDKSVLNTYNFKITEEGLKEIPKKVEKVKNANQLIDVLQELNKCGKGQAAIVEITENIDFSTADKNKLDGLLNKYGKKELVVPSGVTIAGDPAKKCMINLNGQVSLTLKGNYSGLAFVTIRNSAGTGVQIYDSRDTYLRNVNVEDSKGGCGIFVNGSNVKLDNCTTKNNKECGILVSKSLDLEKRKKETTSSVDVVGGLNQNEEGKPSVVIKNLKLDKLNVNQNNTFKGFKGNAYRELPATKYETKEWKKESFLNPMYYDKDLGIDCNTKVTETYISYYNNK